MTLNQLINLTKNRQAINSITLTEPERNVGLGFILAILTFSDLAPVYTQGIDPPLAWAFNYFLVNDIHLLDNLIFPHGPLAFLMYPVPFGYNYVITEILHFFVKVYLAYIVLVSYKGVVGLRLLMLCLFLFLLFQITPIGHFMMIAAAGSYLMYFRSGKLAWLIVPLIGNVIGILMKINIGATIAALSIGFAVIEVFFNKRPLRVLAFASLGIALFFLVWFSLSRDFTAMLRFFEGHYYLSTGNSSAVSYYPDNNWYLLLLVFICLIGILIHNKTLKVTRFYTLFALALFTIWLHGMSRQDGIHTGQMFIFLVYFAILLFAEIEKQRFYHFLVITVMLSTFFINLRNTSHFGGFTTEIKANGPFKLGQFLFAREWIEEYYAKISYDSIERNRVNPEIRKLIGNSTVDVYPWDYSYIVVNDFKWQPRPILHSYAGYNSWLDEQDKNHFESDIAPDYLILDLYCVDRNYLYGYFESIDYRHLLNDEPKTTMAILNNYEIIHSERKMMLFKKTKGGRIEGSEIIGSGTIGFDERVSVPIVSDGILRIKCNFKPNVKGRIKQQVYKGDDIVMDYYLKSDSLKWHKIVKANAADGLWITPYIFPKMESLGDETVLIKFRSNLRDNFINEIEYQWELHHISESVLPPGLDALEYRFKKANALFGKYSDQYCGEPLVIGGG